MNITGDPGARLKTDGRFGPKTKARVDRDMAQRGRAKVEEAAGLGHLASAFENPTLLRDAPKLNARIGQGLKPLFGTQPNGAPPSIVAKEVQETVNETIGEAQGSARPAIKVDGILGPKTAGALKTAIAADGSDGFIRRLGGRLGFL